MTTARPDKKGRGLPLCIQARAHRPAERRQFIAIGVDLHFLLSSFKPLKCGS